MTTEDAEKAIAICIKSGVREMDFVANIIYSQQARIGTLEDLITKWELDYEELNDQFIDCKEGVK